MNDFHGLDHTMNDTDDAGDLIEGILTIIDVLLQGKATGEVWVQTLLTKDYKDLDLAERGAILAALTHLTLDGPTMRNTLEARQEEASRVRKQMWEEARVGPKPFLHARDHQKTVLPQCLAEWVLIEYKHRQQEWIHNLQTGFASRKC